MNFAMLTAPMLCALTMAMHWRFTPRHAELGPSLLLACGVTGPLLSLTIGDAALTPANAAVLLAAVAAALSVRVRLLVLGVPPAYRPAPGLTVEALAEQITLQAAASEQRIDLLARQADAHSAAQQVQFQALRTAFDNYAEAQLLQNRESLMAALSGVIDDFDTRINGQLRTHLATLNELVAREAQIQEKQRLHVNEMMHHTRRDADQMERTTQAFRALVEQSAALAALGGQVQQALSLLGPRQDQLQTALGQTTADLLTLRESVAGVQARLLDALDDVLIQSRRAIDSTAQRSAQRSGELAQTLQRCAEQTQALSKQLTALGGKLSTDLAPLAPLAQQLKRVADLSKNAK